MIRLPITIDISFAASLNTITGVQGTERSVPQSREKKKRADQQTNVKEVIQAVEVDEDSQVTLVEVCHESFILSLSDV